MAGKHHNLGHYELHSANRRERVVTFEKSSSEWSPTRDMDRLPYRIVDSAVLALQDEKLGRAVVLLSSAEAIYAGTGAVPGLGDRIEVNSLSQETGETVGRRCQDEVVPAWDARSRWIKRSSWP